MTIEELTHEVAVLRARLRLQRDLISWLVASLLGQGENAESQLKAVHRFLSERIGSRQAYATGELTIAESMQAELDVIVSHARLGLPKPEGEEG